MYKSSLALAVALGVLAQQAGAAGFVEDSKLSLSSRTMYFNNDNREAHGNPRPDQRESGQGFKLDYISGFTEGTVGFGVDAQALWGIRLDGGKGYHKGGFFPDDGKGAADQWARFGANAKARFSKTEAHFGSALAPNLPILVSNDGRLLPQTFEGGTIQSKEIDNLTINAGQLTHAMGRASSNRTGLSVAGATAESNKFRYGGLDYKLTPDLTLQYYYSNLEDFYKQHFLGATHVFKIADDQSFKTDLRYFDSSSDGKNGHDATYNFSNNGGYAKNTGKVDNKTWSAMFTYTLGGHALMLGRQQVGDDGGFVWMGQGNLVNDSGTSEGAGGSSFYLFTDSMINQFARAGENTNFGQYSYDFAALGVPGLKASVAYLRGDDIRYKSGHGTYNEWERDARVDYTIQQGTFKGLGFSLRQGVYRGSGGSTSEFTKDQDQTRFIVNYTYAFM
ncbi:MULTISPECIES: OprD family porin [Pseudomonas]|uniref:OprD family porin n=1 Tax=Pseudomonas TaxID=286 RepID=UPI0003C7D099|nr:MULTISPECIES: OprD family porin [Pseudomonas]AIN61417.1 porin [Pseudomonas soli]MBI6951005.1 OprD family porin [Pseudomonas sp. CCOS 191]PMZ96589.1 outer membrane porin, OprD family [Pseudomonas sp. FW305-42]PNA21802.1 outer membrane porin, OprD family [Pseudomonas sp. MPR-R1B]PNB29234.1 outer membrane porin, OprD family [Pseudomonas sp. DP16D-E2]